MVVLLDSVMLAAVCIRVSTCYLAWLSPTEICESFNV